MLIKRKMIENILSNNGLCVEKVNKNVWIVNADISFDSTDFSQLMVLLPYCLRNLNCKYRTLENCDLESNECNIHDKDCNIKPLYDLLNAHSIAHYTIVNDDCDVNYAFQDFRKGHELKAVIVAPCPLAVSENKQFFSKYKVPFFLYLIDNYEGCKVDEAKKGKLRRQTAIDLEGFLEMIEQVFKMDDRSLNKL